MAPKKILIALSIEDDVLQPLHAWGRRFDWEKIEDVHFLHIVKKNITPLEFGLLETPDEESFEDMRPALDKFLHEEAHRIIPSQFHPKIHFHLLRDFYPDEETVELCRDIKPDLLVLASHGKHRMFHHSFSEHIIKTAPCDVYVVRPEGYESRVA